MAKDILIDISSGDALVDDNLDKNSLIFETVWGDLFDDDAGGNIVYLNVIVPINYIQSLIYDMDGKFKCNIKADYYPKANVFYIRLVTRVNNIYSKVSNVQLPELSKAVTYSYGDDSLTELAPTQLMLINQDGYYTILFRKEVVHNIPNVEVYSMAGQDLLCGDSDSQSAKLLAKCGAGNNYRYPTTGVGITDYINGVVENSDLSKVLLDEFENNHTPIQDAEFDSTTGNLNVTQSEEEGEVPEAVLSKDELDYDFVNKTTDEYIRQFNIEAISEDTDYAEFLNEIAARDDIFCIYGLKGVETVSLNDTSKTDTGYSFIKKDFGGYYSEISKSGYTIITAVLKKNDIINFRLNEYVLAVFITKNNDISEMDLFDTKQVTLFNRDEYGSCGLVNEECYIHYCIKTDKFGTDECGVFKLDISNNALQDVLTIVRDRHTSELKGYVTPNSRIQNVQMHNITGQIFLTKLSDNE